MKYVMLILGINQLILFMFDFVRLFSSGNFDYGLASWSMILFATGIMGIMYFVISRWSEKF